MRKVRVAFFAEVLIRNFDGATRTMFQIIEKIDKTRFEYLFFCGVSPEGKFDHEVFHVPALTIPFNKTYKMASMFRMGPRITRKLDKFKPDVIHISTPSPLGYFGLKYAQSKNIPVLSIYHTHFISYIKYYTKKTPILTQALEGAVTFHNRSFYDKCDLVYMPTSEMVRQLEEKGFNTDHMKIWRRGINTDIFNPSKQRKGFVQRLVQNNKPNLLFVSRLVWKKTWKH